MRSSTKIDSAEIAKHNSRSSCWIVLYDRVWDVTNFLEEHPGGAKIILQYAGSDATAAYDQYHLPNVVEETLSAAAKLGRIEPDSMAQTTSSVTSQPNSSSSNMTKTQAVRPPLDSILNLDDIEKTAEKCLAPNAWAYYASAADDELSKDNNRRAYQKVTIRPRLLRDVSSIDTRTAILGYPCSLPIFVSPAAMAKLAHPEGECAIAAGVGAEDLIQVASTSSSWPIEKIMEARVHKDQPVFFQLYVHKDRQRAETLSRKAERAGAKALWVTIDTPVMGKRERDERVMATIQSSEESGIIKEGHTVKGIARTMGHIIDPSLTWEDLKWIRSITSLPLVLKGIQCVEDAILAYEHGVQGIVLSNHGGRSQDTAQSPLLTLLEIRKHAPELINSKMEIYLDGGIRRGTDVIKALALGATAVGLGRPFLMSLVYGKPGVHKVVQIMRDEISRNMALIGARNIGEIVPEMLNISELQRDLSRTIKL